MSIDMSSLIPVINTLDIRFDKEIGTQKIKPVGGSSDSNSTGLQLDRDNSSEPVISNRKGVGDTYNANGDLTKEITLPSNKEGQKMRLDIII